MINPDRDADAAFSLHDHLLEEILRRARPLGHHEDRATLNLGFGFLYYGLVRALRPQHVVVIGSGYGFSVVCLALGLKDNRAGRLTFVDPSYSLLRDGPLRTVGGVSQWDHPERVKAHFRGFGVHERVTHYRMTSAEFFAAYPQCKLPPIDLAFIDGNHSYDDVRADFLNASARMRRNAYLLLHDTNIYIREFLRHAGVKRWLRVLEREPSRFQLVDFPFDSGVALVRVLDDSPWQGGP